MYDKIVEILSKDFPTNIQEVENFSRGVNQLVKNPKTVWAKSYDIDVWCALFKKVANEGLWFDHKHITMQSTGISYDYVAYFNKMILKYPESKVDAQLVYKGDIFKFNKKDGLITYSHEFKNPFEQTDEKIEGGYCIIKNRKGEFITILSKADFEKHKEVARTKYIWNSWYQEMCLKTLMKKATKVHFEDIYTNMNNEDNKQNDLDLLSQKNAKEGMGNILEDFNNNK